MVPQTHITFCEQEVRTGGHGSREATRGGGPRTIQEEEEEEEDGRRRQEKEQKDNIREPRTEVRELKIGAEMRTKIQNARHFC